MQRNNAIKNQADYSRVWGLMNDLIRDRCKEQPLADRVDLAYAILENCLLLEKFENQHRKNAVIMQSIARTIPARKVYQERMLKFLQKILGVTDKDSIDKLMAERAAKRTLNPQYIPGAHNIENPTNLPGALAQDNPEEAPSKRRARYNWRKVSQTALMVKRMSAVAVNKEDRKKDKKTGIKMHTAAERDIYRVIILNGLVQKENYSSRGYKPFSTLKMSSHGKDRLAAFTINLDGEFSVFEHKSKADRVAHSTMNNSRALLFAGEIKIEGGKITLITDHSGHYQPELENVFHLLKYLYRQGVNLDAIAIDLYAKLELPEITSVERPDLNFKHHKHVYNARMIFETMVNLEKLKALDKTREFITKRRFGTVDPPQKAEQKELEEKNEKKSGHGRSSSSS